MYFDIDVGTESILGIHMVLGLEPIVWTTLNALAEKRGS